MPTLLPQVDPVRLQAHVEVLAGLGNRWWTRPGYRRALRYCDLVLRGAGLRPRVHAFTALGARGWNLVADLPGPPGPPALLLGAHLDSQAPGAFRGRPAPGADDNASGCAGVLEAGRLLARQHLDRPVRLVLFGGEEQGLFGSRAFVTAMSAEERAALQEALILDEIAFNTRGTPTCVLEHGPLSISQAARLLNLAAQHTSLETALNPDYWGSDHVPFLDAGMSAVLLIEADDQKKPYNHTADDLPETLDYAMAAEFTRMALAWALDAAT